MATFLCDYVDDKDLTTFEDNFERERASGMVPVDTQFQYAYCLVRSKYKEDIRKGIGLLNELCTRGCDQRDFLFFLGLGHFKLAEYSNALKFTQRILTIEPNNRQALELEKLIEKDMKKQGLLGMAVVGGAALTGILFGLIFAKKSN